MFDFRRLRSPIIQAPMAGGINTPELVAASINAGVVGSFGFAYSSPEQISRDIKAARSLIHSDAQGALNCNFFVVPENFEASAQDSEKALNALKSLEFAGNLELNLPGPPYFPNLESQLESVWKDPPDILTFHFGVPDQAILSQARSMNIKVGMTATSAQEAEKVEKAGGDFIVAQGIEAGGNRGVFQPDGEDKKLKTLELIKMLTGSSKLPLVAAGGIMNRNQLFTMTQAGATAVQMGTAFLTCAESGAPQEYKEMLLDQKTRPSLFTRAFSGRPARALENEFISLMQGQPLLPFPLQNTMTASIRKKAQKLENPEYQSLWAGENYRECRKESVAELIERMSL